MATVKRRAAEALFKSGGEGEATWLYFALPAGWAITRNGVRVAFGTPDRASIQTGLEKFAAFTHPVAPAADPVVLAQLNRIEGESGRGANGKGVAKLLDDKRASRVHGGEMIPAGMS